MSQSITDKTSHNDTLANHLSPCPFCGATPVWHRIGNDHTKKRSIRIRCPDCRIELTNSAIHQGFDWLEDITAKAWNRRA